MATDALSQVEHALGVTRAFSQIRGAEWARVRGWSEWDGYERAESGLFVPSEQRRRLLNPSPVAIDLFAGAGGFSLGFHQAGIHVIGALEMDQWAALTYLVNLGAPSTRIYCIEPGDRARLEKAVCGQNRIDAKSGRAAVARRAAAAEQPGGATAITENADGTLSWDGAGAAWRHLKRERLAEDSGLTAEEAPGMCLEPVEVLFFGDARKITGNRMLELLGRERGEIDVVCGGPPCQGFSTAGGRNIYDVRNSLIFDFCRLALEIHPKTMVMENVEGLVSMVTADGEPVVDAICRTLEEGGFGAHEAIREMLETTSGAGFAHRGMGRSEKAREGVRAGRGERRRALAARRKEAKRAASVAVAVGADGTTYLQDELFSGVAR